MIKYHILFEVKFFHKFYESYSSNEFEIILDSATQAILSSFSLIYKQTPEGFVILYKEDKQYLLEKLKEEINLVIGIKSKNRHFATYSNLAPLNASKKYFFTNKSINTGTPQQPEQDPAQIILHPDSFVDNKNLYLYCLDNNVLKDVLPAEEVLIEKDGEILFDAGIEGWENFSKILGKEYGSYTVTLRDSNETLQLYYINDSLARAFSIINLHVGGTESTNFNVIKGNRYQIRFENRSALWSYYFVSESERTFESVNVFSGKEKLAFSEPEQVTLVNGQLATKVTSLEVMPLQQRYNGQQFVVELKEQALDPTQQEVKKKINLPTPDITRIKGKKNSTIETYFSEIYIYL